MKISEVFGSSGYGGDYDGGHRRRYYKKRHGHHKYHWRGYKKRWYRHWDDC